MAPTTGAGGDEKEEVRATESPSFMLDPPEVVVHDLVYYEKRIFSKEMKLVTRQTKWLYFIVLHIFYSFFAMSVTVAQRQLFFPQFSLRGMESGLRRKNSDGKVQFVCPSNAHDIEIDITSNSDEPFEVAVQTPQGEKGYLYFDKNGSNQQFTPETRTCGHGVWTVQIFKILQTGREEVSRTEIELNGVGTLFYHVDEELQVALHGTDFLKSKNHCPLTH